MKKESNCIFVGFCTFSLKFWALFACFFVVCKCSFTHFWASFLRPGGGRRGTCEFSPAHLTFLGQIWIWNTFFFWTVNSNLTHLFKIRLSFCWFSGGVIFWHFKEEIWHGGKTTLPCRIHFWRALNKSKHADGDRANQHPLRQCHQATNRRIQDACDEELALCDDLMKMKQWEGGRGASNITAQTSCHRCVTLERLNLPNHAKFRDCNEILIFYGIPVGYKWCLWVFSNHIIRTPPKSEI